MEFDINKVYSAVNAEQLEEGSLIIPALNLADLERNVEADIDILTLVKVADKSCVERFGVDIYDDLGNLRYYPFVYLVKRAKRKRYIPFASIQEAREIINKHGGWVRSLDRHCYYFITEYFDSRFGDKKEVCVGKSFFSLNDLNDLFVFADDGTPCGELVE